MKKEMEKYDMIIVYDGMSWNSERRYYLSDIIKTFIYEWQEKYQNKPTTANLKMGVQNYEYIRLLGAYNHSKNIIEILSLDIDIECDWSVHPNYLELNLSNGDTIIN